MGKNEYKFQAGEALSELDQSKRNKLIEALSSNAVQIVHKALNRTNKVLAKYGYCITVEIKFHELEK